ncbi:MAG: GAF domain-containing protein, partial [Dehalococcoidia bacterium]
MAKVRQDRAKLNLSGEAALFASLGSIASSQNSAEVAMQRSLSAVCKYLGWPVGHLYVDASDGSGELAPTSTWHLDDPGQFTEFRDVTEKTRFAPGEGLPGRVFELGKPVWIADVQKDANFPRNRLSKNIKVRAAFAVPVEISGITTAVLEFFTTEVIEPDERVLEVADVLGAQIGQILERQRTSEELLKVRQLAEAEVRAQLSDELNVGKTLAEIGRLLATPDIDRVYEQFGDMIRELIPHDRVVLVTIDKDRDIAIARYVGGKDVPAGAAGRVYSLSESPAGVMIDWVEPKSLSLDEHQEFARRFPDWKERLDSGLLSVMGCALIWEGHPVGLLVL